MRVKGTYIFSLCFVFYDFPCRFCFWNCSGGVVYIFIYFFVSFVMAIETY